MRRGRGSVRLWKGNGLEVMHSTITACDRALHTCRGHTNPLKIFPLQVVARSDRHCEDGGRHELKISFESASEPTFFAALQGAGGKVAASRVRSAFGVVLPFPDRRCGGLV